MGLSSFVIGSSTLASLAFLEIPMDRRPRLRNAQNQQRQNWRLQDVPSGNKTIQRWQLINERPLLADTVEKVLFG
jgi:hypothetical protein